MSKNIAMMMAKRTRRGKSSTENCAKSGIGPRPKRARESGCLFSAILLTRWRLPDHDTGKSRNRVGGNVLPRMSLQRSSQKNAKSMVLF
jgi:hypothetical protein